MYFYVVLHPRHKLQYFKNAGWLKGWIDTARGIVETQYKHAYASRDVEEDDMSDQIVRSFFTIFSLLHYCSFLFHQETVPTSSNTFDHLPALSAPHQSELRDELERYLSTDPEEVADVLLWWFERKHIYPHLHRMALDYLTIPRKLIYSFVI